MEFASSSELEVQAARSMHLINPQKPGKYREKGESGTPQQHQLWSEVVLLMLISNRNYLTFTEEQRMFCRKCKIPVQLVRHTALQLLLPLYEFIPNPCKPAAFSRLWITPEHLSEEQAFLLEHTLEDFI